MLKKQRRNSRYKANVADNELGHATANNVS